MSIHQFAKEGNFNEVRYAIEAGIPVDTLDPHGLTPLACAVNSKVAGVEIVKLLLDSGANANLTVTDRKQYPVELAACSGSISKVQALLDAGADIHYESKAGYTIAIHAVYRLHDSDDLVPMIEFLHRNHASLDAESEHGESPISVASCFGRFDAVKCLLDLGADETPMNWNELMKTLAWGTNAEFESALEQTCLVNHRDRFERTAFHLCAFGPYLEKATLLHDLGIDIDASAIGGDTAMMICAERGNVEMLSWLIEKGADIEALNEMGETALIVATGAGKPECLRVLLEAGANPTHKATYGSNAMSQASDPRVIRLLQDAGEDIADMSIEAKRNLLGFVESESIDCTIEDYRSGCTPRFGKSNPEQMKIPFWNAMIRSGANASRPRFQFDPKDEMPSPIWSFDRFGMSFTRLPDGRFVQIAGEHEDYYDQDFYIYNDVIVHDTKGNFNVFGYPKDVFPPTDFHSATYVNGFIYVIGSIGYKGTRRFGETPIYRINCKKWSIQPISATGDNPGWIHRHKCRLVDGTLEVTGGEVCKQVKSKEVTEDNLNVYQLDLATMRWTWIS